MSRPAPVYESLWPGAGRLIHLAVHEGDLRSAEVILLDHARFGHVLVEIVAFPGALADTGEYRHSAMEPGDIVDLLHDNHRLTHPRAAKRADLSAFHKRTDQINYFDSGNQHLGGSRLVNQARRRAVDRIVFLRLDRPAFVDRVAAHIEYPPHPSFSDGHGDGHAGVDDLVTAFETLRAGHGDRPDPAVGQVLLHLKRDFDGLALNFVVHRQRVIDTWQLFRKCHVHDRTDDLNNLAFIHVGTLSLSFCQPLPSWPPAISRSSLVILP